MGLDTMPVPPSVAWAQTDCSIYLTFNLECEKPDIRFEPKSVLFKGLAQDQKVYEVDIPLYEEILPEKSTQVNKGRVIEVVLAKKNINDGFWPFLTSDKMKHHWLKIDFDRWRDEDESDEDLLSDQIDFDSGDGMGMDDTNDTDEDDIVETK
ncbi:unnamed protein product [Leptidea sinapis]|uniref:CS domain-containing protein n=1 Tax=Leptidea sinapis TaxID=189913 RepID=A0A5E4Q7A9_9NEOP|nr:unnamed protein product [Leptidea sinapis]